MSTAHATLAPSDWVQRWSHLVCPGGKVLDVACGHGRHLRWFAGLGHPVCGVDRSEEALASIAQWAPHTPACETLLADMENGPWPLADRQFDAVVVTNYLWRPLIPTLLASLASGGVLIYETFAAGNETVGRPSNPDFLLQPGELLAICQPLRVLAYEDGYLDHPARYVQRIVARRHSLECTLPRLTARP